MDLTVLEEIQRKKTEKKEIQNNIRKKQVKIKIKKKRKYAACVNIMLREYEQKPSIIKRAKRDPCSWCKIINPVEVN